MKYQVEYKIDQTLSCLDDDKSITVSDLFVDSVSHKINQLRFRRGIGCSVKAFYPVVIALMVGLNFAVLATMITPYQTTAQPVDQVSIIAREYGIGQNSYTAF